MKLCSFCLVVPTALMTHWQTEMISEVQKYLFHTALHGAASDVPTLLSADSNTKAQCVKHQQFSDGFQPFVTHRHLHLHQPILISD